MKKNIENSFKESLGNLEMPYNAAAWTSLSAKLDAKMPASLPKSNFKWYATASTIVVLAVSSYFIFKGDAEIPTQNDVVASQNEAANSENTQSNNESTNPVNQNNGATSHELSEGQSANDISNPLNEVEPLNGAPTITPSDLVDRVNKTSDRKTDVSNGNPNELKVSSPGEKPATQLILPTVPEICEGSTFVVENVNDEALLIEGPDMHYIIPANSKRTVKAKASGLHTIGSLNTAAQRNEFIVKSTVTADFSIDSENKFENGLPTTKVIANATGTYYSWIFNHQKVNGREASAHFYTKGNHDISLTVTGSNGCSATITKSIYVEDKYNLLAQNAFVPTDIDPKLNTFMPLALKERNVKFTLQIYDTQDGHLIFESNDASNGWDGTDMKTGRMVSFEQAYIWKAVIVNPEPNEINEYGGSIIPLPARR